MKMRSKKQAEAFTKFSVLGRLYGMQTTVKQISYYYDDLNLNSFQTALKEAINNIRGGTMMITKTAIPYRKD